MKPKLTYTMVGTTETSNTPLGRVGIFTTHTGGYVATINGRELPGRPVYSSADAAKLAVERQLLELARVVVEILG